MECRGVVGGACDTWGGAVLKGRGDDRRAERARWTGNWVDDIHCCFGRLLGFRVCQRRRLLAAWMNDWLNSAELNSTKSGWLLMDLAY